MLLATSTQSTIRRIGVDSETALIQAGNLTPPLVCVSTAQPVDYSVDHYTTLGLRDEGIAFYRRALSDLSLILVIHNAPYDLGVACYEEPGLIFQIFDAFLEGRIRCTIVTQKLIDIALGMRKFRRVGSRVVKTTYDLAELINLYYGERVEKGDTWRKSYWLLRNTPIERWPLAAKKYAILDSVLHLRLDDGQQRLIKETLGGELPNQIEQQRANWVLHLMSMWGIRADPKRVDYFVAHCEEEIRKMHDRLYRTCIRCGGQKQEHNDAYCASLPRQEGDVDPPGFKNTGIFRIEKGRYVRTMDEIRRRVVESFTRQNLPVPMTDPSSKFPKGQVQTDRDTLEQTTDPYLHVLAESMTFEKHLGQWGPVLRAATLRPVCCRYEVLVDTGRTASSGSEGQEGTNIQNPPRKGDVRPAIIPSPGCVLCSTDADTIELRAHAQNALEMVGWSRMAERLIEQAKSKGPDLHEVLGASIVGVDPRELQARRKAGDVDMSDARQFAKIPNFGFPGGLGAETFVAYAAGQLSREAFQKWFGLDRNKAVIKAATLREIWFDTFPENRYYFEIIGKMIDRKKGYGTIQQRKSMRIRGQTRFTAAANGFFQGRVADAEKDILFRLGYECYTGRCSSCWAKGCEKCNGTGKSILWGSRPVMFLHDEPILEHPIATAAERAERQRQIVVEGLSIWMPDIPCTSSAVLMRRWQKGAEPGYLCTCGQFGGKPDCSCGKKARLVPVKPQKTEKKVIWVYDDGSEEQLAA